jgi:hypothetical protein
MMSENREFYGWVLLLVFVTWLITPEAYAVEAVARLAGWIKRLGAD